MSERLLTAGEAHWLEEKCGSADELLDGLGTAQYFGEPKS